VKQNSSLKLGSSLVLLVPHSFVARPKNGSILSFRRPIVLR
jgi:hypothetical protein